MQNLKDGDTQITVCIEYARLDINLCNITQVFQWKILKYLVLLKLL